MKKVMGLFICTFGLSGCFTFDDLPGVTLAREHDITIDFENPSLQPSTAAPAIAQAPPDTEVFLASLSSVDGKLAIGPPINISNSPGYDNQPSFTPDGQAVLFASVRGQAARPALTAVEGAASGAASVPSALLQTDIYRYEIASRRIRRVTHTPEGEYSPTVMPDGKHISVVRVEADGTQRLWRVLDNGPRASRL
jgi:hypothetical protein